MESEPHNIVNTNPVKQGLDKMAEPDNSVKTKISNRSRYITITIVVLVIAYLVRLSSSGWSTIIMIWSGLPIWHAILFVLAGVKFANKTHKTRQDYFLYYSMLATILIYAFTFLDFLDTTGNHGIMSFLSEHYTAYILAFSVQNLVANIIFSIFLIISCRKPKLEHKVVSTKQLESDHKNTILIKQTKRNIAAPAEWLSFAIVFSLFISEFFIYVTQGWPEFLQTVVYPIILLLFLITGINFAHIRNKSKTDFGLFGALCIGSYLACLTYIAQDNRGHLSGTLLGLTDWPPVVIEIISVLAIFVMSMAVGYLALKRYQEKKSSATIVRI